MIPPWVIVYLGVALSSVDRLFDAVKNALIAFWNSLVAFFTEQMQAAGWVLSSAGDLAGQTLALVQALYYLGWWTAYTIVPRWAGTVIDQIQTWVGGELRSLQDWANSVLTDIRNWTSSLINAIRSDLGQLRADATGWITDLWNTVNWVYHLVSLLLTDPGVLAQWVFLPLVSYALSYVESNSIALGRWFLGKAVSWTMQGASVLEDIIVAIF